MKYLKYHKAEPCGSGGNQIEKMLHTNKILFILIFLFSCNNIRKKTINIKEEKENVVSDLFEETKNMVLALEICPNSEVGFCYDGGDQGYRLWGLGYFIEVNNEINFYTSYKNGIYTIAGQSLLPKLLQNDSFYPSISYPLYDTLSSDSSIIVINKKYNRKIKSFLKKIKSNASFSGEFRYNFYEVSFKSVYVKDITIIRPNFDNKGEILSTKLNVITEILKIKPVNGKIDTIYYR